MSTPSARNPPKSGSEREGGELPPEPGIFRGYSALMDRCVITTECGSTSVVWCNLADHEANLRGGGEEGAQLLVEDVLEPRGDGLYGERVGHGYEESVHFQPDGRGALEPHPQARDVDPVSHSAENVLPDAVRPLIRLVQRRLFLFAREVGISCARGRYYR